MIKENNEILGRAEKSSASCRKREDGFTLMELIVVCTLIALFLSLGIPTFRNSLLTNQLDTTARKIIGTIKELRNLAVRENKPYLLHFELDENRLWYELDAAKTALDAKTDEKGLRFPEGVKLEEIETHFQGQKSTGSVTLWISRRGYMDQTVMHLSEGESNRITLFFSPFSGSAKVYDDFIDFE